MKSKSIANEDFHTSFPAIPPTAKLAILLPTVRWSPLARAIIGKMVGVASEETVVLIGDNSENEEKRVFLKKITNINSSILSVSHEKNIGAFANICFLHEWSKNVSYTAILADDDWITPNYHVEAYRFLEKNPHVSCCAAGASFADFGDGKLININQPSMAGATTIERVRRWDPRAARITMFNTSKRIHLNHAIEYHNASPLGGVTLMENLWELSRLSQGEFASVPGQTLYLHYPATRQGGATRLHNLLFKDAKIDFLFTYFASLSTAIQCAIFLKGAMSPIENIEDRDDCAQHVFSEIFNKQFLPVVMGHDSKEAVGKLFTDTPHIIAGFSEFCYNSNSGRVLFDADLLDWFIEILTRFETEVDSNQISISQEFRTFAYQALANDLTFSSHSRSPLSRANDLSG